MLMGFLKFQHVSETLELVYIYKFISAEEQAITYLDALELSCVTVYHGPTLFFFINQLDPLNVSPISSSYGNN